MCGRYTLSAPEDVIADIFDLSESAVEAVGLSPRYNIAPTQDVPVVGLTHDDGRTLGLMRWGLVPHWAKDPSIGNRMINARGETVAAKPAFRSSFKKRRCLVVADGFYEWKKLKSGKQPHHIRLKDGRPFAIAGLWSRWYPKEETGDGEGVEPEPLLSCTLITTGPNELMKGIHDRMPVILPADSYDRWLDPETEGDLGDLLVSYPAEEMEAYPVSTRVNNPRNEGPANIEPAETLG